MYYIWDNVDETATEEEKKQRKKERERKKRAEIKRVMKIGRELDVDEGAMRFVLQDWLMFSEKETEAALKKYWRPKANTTDTTDTTDTTNTTDSADSADS